VRVLLRVVITILCTLSSAAQSGTIWDPAKTFVLVASVTQWPPKAGLPPFIEEKRRDEDLVNQFKLSGVPAGNIVFLKDSAATHAAICSSLGTLAARAGPGSTLFFYFQGQRSPKIVLLL
jgi:hypothetical protein